MSNTLKKQEMLSRGYIYDMLDAEDEYAQKWSKDKESQNPNFPDHTVSRTTGQPFSMMDWMTFAKKYVREAEEAYGNFCPDLRAIRIRMLKIASLMVTALQVYGEPTDYSEIAGKSSADFPVLRGGLKTFLQMKEDQIYKTEDGTEYMLGPNNTLRRIDPISK